MSAINSFNPIALAKHAYSPVIHVGADRVRDLFRRVSSQVMTSGARHSPNVLQ